MAALNFTATTLAAVDQALEKAQDSDARPYLGMSQIGGACDRALWYSFRWATTRVMPASAIKAIQDGFRGEEVMIERLRMVDGVTLHTVDPATGRQFGQVGIGGHFKGHLDGAIVGILEAPKTWHVWEHKQVNEQKFAKLQKLVAELGEKAALKEWDSTYFGQAQCYMGFTGMERHFLTVATPGGRAYTSVRTEFDRAAFDALCDRAQRVISAPVPPDGISTDPAWYECKWCDHRELCHGQAAPLPTCRSCTHATPEMDGVGAWSCARHSGKRLTTAEQKAGCQAHRYIPILLRNIAEPVDASDKDNWVKYRLKEDGAEFVNGAPPAGFESVEIHASKHKTMLADSQVQEVRKAWQKARVVG